MDTNEYTVTITYDDDEFDVTYRLPPQEQDDAFRMRFERTPDDLNLITDVVAAFVVAWDVVDGGQPIPPIPERLDDLPLSLLTAVLHGIAHDIRQQRLAAYTWLPTRSA